MLGITEVIDNLFLSGLESCSSILNKGIRSVINISSECPKQDLGPTVDYEKISIADSPTTSIQTYFDRLADRIEQNLQQGKKTLVHCYVGRSRSASIVLAYLMKYKNMSLREAFYYLRSRRPIIGPNFGFIRQLINYEKVLFGTASVAFVDTAFGLVPDIYLALGESTPYRRQATSIPIQVTNKNLSPLSNSNSFLNRSITNTFPNQNSRIMSSYSNSINNNTNNISTSYRPITSRASSFLNDPYDQDRFHSSPLKPYESIREPFLSTRFNTLRAGKYFPSTFNRYYLP